MPAGERQPGTPYKNVQKEEKEFVPLVYACSSPMLRCKKDDGDDAR